MILKLAFIIYLIFCRGFPPLSLNVHLHWLRSDNSHSSGWVKLQFMCSFTVSHSFGKGRKRGRMMVTWHGLEAWLMKQVAEQRRTEASK